MIHMMENRLFFLISNSGDVPHDLRGWTVFTTDEDFVYYPFCNDFGPFNLAIIYRFCAKLKYLLESTASPDGPVLYYTTGDNRQAANCAVLIASFLVMHMGRTMEEACQPLAQLGAGALAEFRDALHGPADFTLTVRDCVAGLARASAAGLISFTDGSFDPDAYDLLDDPLNGDVHAVVPGRLIAFKGPCADAVSASGPWADRGGARDFHPAYYVEMFRRMGVQLVVRLCEPRYDEAECTRAGVPLLDLRFDGHSAPPLAAVFRFFRATDGVAGGGGAVAVHCTGGRGRTGTLVALWLMRTHRFTAREAIAWLRVARPGSVVGPQQQYLEGMQAKMWQWGALSPLQQAELIRRGCDATAPAAA
jgi:cell division cycle 14